MKASIPGWVLFLALLAMVSPARGADSDTLAAYGAPGVLQREHRQIHQLVSAAAFEPGRVGHAARRLSALMGPHVAKEEAYALPPLALLPQLAGGDFYLEMREILPITDRLAAEMPILIVEHDEIVAAAEKLLEAARVEGREDLVRMAEEVIRHAQLEEQILYPAALLVGEVVEGRLGRIAWYPDSR